jgi:dynein heavy chain
MIDPQALAKNWITKMEKGNKLMVLNFDSPDLMRKLSKCVEFGIPVLLEVGEKLDSTFDPLLLKQTFVLNGQTTIRIGDKTVPYHENFRMYITSRNMKISSGRYISYITFSYITSELAAKVNLIDFSITTDALEDQLLTLIVRHERVDIENKKDRLMESLLENKKELKKIEDQILSLMAGNIIEDEKLADTLTASKKTVEEIKQRIAEAATTENQIHLVSHVFENRSINLVSIG